MSGEHKQAEAVQSRHGLAAPDCEADPCSRLLDCLLPVDAPVAYANLAAAAESNPARVAAAAAEEGAPSRARTGRGRCQRRGAPPKAAGRGARSGGARARSRRVATQKSTAACSGAHAAGEAGGGGGGGVGGGHADMFAAVALDPEQQLSMNDLLGTALGHEELLAQLDAAQEILAHGMDDLLAGGGTGVVGAQDAMDEAGVEDSV